jgi:hypothetical protein
VRKTTIKCDRCGADCSDDAVQVEVSVHDANGAVYERVWADWCPSCVEWFKQANWGGITDDDGKDEKGESECATES